MPVGVAQVNAMLLPGLAVPMLAASVAPGPQFTLGLLAPLTGEMSLIWRMMLGFLAPRGTFPLNCLPSMLIFETKPWAETKAAVKRGTKREIDFMIAV